jgi:phospholipid-transporting ATPase
MELKKCSIAGNCYSNDENSVILNDLNNKKNNNRRLINEFLTILATCHTVIPEHKENDIIYQASSPG